MNKLSANTNRFLMLAILLASIIFFVLGLSFPILSSKTAFLRITLNYDNVYLFDSVTMFYKEGEYLLATLIFLTTIILPIVKYAELINQHLQMAKISTKAAKILHAIDKWSMLDVFLVALLLLNFKMDSNIVVMKLKIGTTFIALSVVLRMLSVYFVNNKLK